MLVTDLTRQQDLPLPNQAVPFSDVLAQLSPKPTDEAQTSQTRINTLLNKKSLLKETSKRIVRLRIAIEDCHSKIKRHGND